MCKIQLTRGLDFQIQHYAAGSFKHSSHDFIVVMDPGSKNKLEPSEFGKTRQTVFNKMLVLINTKTAQLTLTTYTYRECTSTTEMVINGTYFNLNPGMCYYLSLFFSAKNRNSDLWS